MSLMLRLLSILAIVSSTLLASTQDKVIEYVMGQIAKNPKIKVDKVTVRESIEVKQDKAWSMYVLDIFARVEQKAGLQPVKAQETLFSNGVFIAPELFNIKTGESIRAAASPKFNEAFYKKENLIYGNANAKHKLAVFSDPLCPFCTELVPELINAAKKYPNDFALYLYHFPLGMHPAAKTVVKCIVAAELKGIKDVVYKTYTADAGKKYGTGFFVPSETNEKKILEAFNKALSLDLSMEDIKAAEVTTHLQNDSDVQTQMLVNSTPSLFFDGTKDADRSHFKGALKALEK